MSPLTHILQHVSARPLAFALPIAKHIADDAANNDDEPPNGEEEDYHGAYTAVEYVLPVAVVVAASTLPS
ncbi:hypothetical protein DYB31_011410 [Aphanomyces astaci]|uniref:Uncharacterized protein n=1 Tax=Aphanomyces astaci TaxID=112090 RepID=A0A397FVW8_APHAT|nr:hypothetical protein DYB31_011410 [Aphanomyces astaci]